MHLIYRTATTKASSKDVDFSHVAMVDHWEAGVRDVRLSMRHKDWLERPRSGDDPGTYDRPADARAPPKRSESR